LFIMWRKGKSYSNIFSLFM